MFVLALDARQPDRGPQGVAVGAVPHLADPLPVAEQLLVAVQERLGVLDQHLDEPRGEHPGIALGHHGVPADEVRLVPGDRQPQTGLEQRVGVVDVEPVVAIGLLQPE